MIHSARDASIAAGADVAVVVVGFTKHEEGEYIGSGMHDVMMTLVPPMDHPIAGFDDPDQGDWLDHKFAGGDGSAMGGDRDTLRLPAEHEALISEARSYSDNVVVVVIAGSAVVMPWLDSIPAAMMLWYAGSEGGAALADVLLGRAEPGGRLPFATPFKEADLVPFDKDATAFTYDLLHGQWHLDESRAEAHLPFGYGLSYTSFVLGEGRWSGARDGCVSIEVTNTGDRAGSTVIQVYGRVPDSAYLRPAKRLVGFQKVVLDPGATRKVRVTVDPSQLDVRVDGSWVVEEAPIELLVGLDSARPVAVTTAG